MSAAKKTLKDSGIDVAFHGPLGGILLFHPRKVDFNLDIGHWFAGKRGYEELEKLANLLQKRIALLHLHDCKFQNSLIKDHLPLG